MEEFENSLLAVALGGGTQMVRISEMKNTAQNFFGSMIPSGQKFSDCEVNRRLATVRARTGLMIE
jgi:hypothetical protein